MLTPDQVIPFLTDERPFVRKHALDYFADGANPIEPLTADHLWAAIDRYGIANSLRFLDALEHVPQTERAYQQFRAALRERGSGRVDYHLQQAAGDIEFDLLAAHREELLADERLLPHVRAHLEQRLALAALPADVLWERLIAHGEEITNRHFGEFDSRISERLVEALARRADSPLIERAMAALHDPRITESWTEVFLVTLLGKARCAAATDLLIEKLLIEDADLLNEEACHALGRIGTLEVVEKARAAYPDKPWGVRLFVREPLRRIKRPQSEAALCELIEMEEDAELQTVLLGDLCDLGSMAGLERARAVIAADPDHPEHRGLCVAMLATAILNGVELPEANAWGEVVARDEAHLRKLERELEHGFAGEMRDRWRRTGQPFEPAQQGEDDRLAELLDPLDAIAAGPEPVPAETFRRDGPKVGRNDPCPCGSGKKYKKCCGG